MRLEIFDFIDETIALVDGLRDVLEEGSRELKDFFEEEFLKFDNILNITSRVKTSMSLKEKIFRNNFYLKYKDPENLVENLRDLIGIRIECRFMEDEEYVYAKLFETFTIPADGGYYYNKGRPNILIRLDVDQPQLQKNGFGIYKIDGKYIKGDRVLRFELQIKSLVNVFWGEVEHKVLYKNYKYLLTEELFRDIMYSLRENLTMIDKQLMILYNHLRDLDESDIEKRTSQLETILSKIVYEIYSEKTRREFGFVVDYRRSCHVIISYLLKKNGAYRPGAYDVVFLRILERLYQIREEDIQLDNFIEFERELEYEDDFCKKIGESILDIINKDFKWNLFFKIIFQIEQGDNAEDFEGFLVFLRDKFLDNLKENRELNTRFGEKEREEIIKDLLDMVADTFKSSREIEFINDDNIQCINKKLNNLLYETMDYRMWQENKEYYSLC
ncbi:MAG: (p)ppGpp synthetase [Tissierellia bacterium]|nr:(p)ppGpp synthetase [Tissierellia bacterium]